MASQSLSALQTANKELNIQLKQLYLAKVNCSCNAFNAIEKIKTTEKVFYGFYIKFFVFIIKEI